METFGRELLIRKLVDHRPLATRNSVEFPLPSPRRPRARLPRRGPGRRAIRHLCDESAAYCSRAGSSGSGSLRPARDSSRSPDRVPTPLCQFGRARSPSHHPSRLPTRRASEFDVRVLGLCDAPRSPRPVPHVLIRRGRAPDGFLLSRDACDSSSRRGQ